MPRVKWFSKEEIKSATDAIINIMNEITPDNLTLLLILIIWLYELFIKIMASQYDKYNDNIDHPKEKMTITYSMVMSMVKENESNYNNRKRNGIEILINAESIRILRNHIAHLKVGIEKVFLKTFLESSKTIWKLIKDSIAYNKILRDRDFINFFEAYKLMMLRCFENDLNDEDKRYFGIVDINQDNTINSTTVYGDDILSKYLKELDKKCNK